jgi:hypothetical protein
MLESVGKLLLPSHMWVDQLLDIQLIETVIKMVKICGGK